MSDNSGVEEVYRRQTSITSHKVHQNVGVLDTQPEFLGISGHPRPGLQLFIGH